MSISVNIHPESFEAQKSSKGNTWLNMPLGDGSWATVHIDTIAQADELFAAAAELKRLIAGEGEGK